MERVSRFNGDACDRCGECLHQCPVLQLPIEEARTEMHNLIERGGSTIVLTRCTSCMSCDIYCPKDAKPYGLIQRRWNERYKKTGAPPLYRFVCPTYEPNIWQLLNLFVSPEERGWIDEWMNGEPGRDDTILLVGSYTRLFPFILGRSALLGFFKPIDMLDQWEGGAYLYQGGYLDLVRDIALRCREDLQAWGAKAAVPLLDAVYHMFAHVHPREMGVIHVTPFINFTEWLKESLDTGRITLTRSLNIAITVHDNCYSKPMGSAVWDTHREILKRCGCRIVEMRHNRQNALCCGFGRGASWKRNISMPFEIINTSMLKFREAEETGASALVSYCAGCIYLLWAAKELLGSRIDVYHSIEIVRIAMGEDVHPPRDHVRRAWDMIAIITYQWIVSLFQKNFAIETITFDDARSTLIPRRYPLLRFIRWTFNSRIMQRGYGRFFRFVMGLVCRGGTVPSP
ncbi:MAG: (Fe-S)-binding protein [Spirochaetes bacterium]|nr:(Fe-S)-binding protein [Spirochaetota bacterium]